VVFIYDCTHAGNIRKAKDLISYHEEYGVILDVAQAEELPLGGNYFRHLMQEEERAKDTAELRRLLYVAMTRAEHRLFLTFTLPPQTQKEKADWDASGEDFTEEVIRRRLSALDEKSEGKRDTFLKLLAEVLSACPPELCAMEVIPVLTKAGIHGRSGGGVKAGNAASQREAALAAFASYDKAELLPEAKAGVMVLQASSLRFKEKDAAETNAGAGVEETALDLLLKKTHTSAADFGSLVHAVLEGRLKGRPCLVPQKFRSRPDEVVPNGTGSDEEKALLELKAQAEEMAASFLASDLGKRCAASSRMEPEFPFISSVAIDGKAVAVSGQIDLLFEDDTGVVVVDFKTDRKEDPEDHYGQLAAYYRAAEDIFAKPVSLWLFYLRSGHAVNVTEEVKALSLEELAAAGLTTID
jgi:ATP-dependent helicase/nuclease subunit A